jgi:hypothetical protein
MMSGNKTDTTGSNKALIAAIIVVGVFAVATVLACGTVAVIFLYNAPWL